MLEQRLGADGRDALLQAVHLFLLPGLDLLAAPPTDHDHDHGGRLLQGSDAASPFAAPSDGGVMAEWAPPLDTQGFVALAAGDDRGGGLLAGHGGGTMSGCIATLLVFQ